MITIFWSQLSKYRYYHSALCYKVAARVYNIVGPAILWTLGSRYHNNKVPKTKWKLLEVHIEFKFATSSDDLLCKHFLLQWYKYQMLVEKY